MVSARPGVSVIARWTYIRHMVMGDDYAVRPIINVTR